jgi:hypothetical protein
MKWTMFGVICELRHPGQRHSLLAGRDATRHGQARRAGHGAAKGH